MRKVLAWIFLVFAAAIFVFAICFTINGTVEVKAYLDELAASGRGGVELLGSGLDALVLIVGLITIVGLIVSGVSFLLAKSRTIKIISLALLLLFVPTVLACFSFIMFP